MLYRTLFLFLLTGMLFSSLTQAADVTVQSGPARTQLLELFTSEGCSSCPPAESWISTLRQSPRLWKNVVPISFHINYWDNLGWTDPLATEAFTHRQREYASAWGADSVYTPAFVLNGNEWRGRDLDSISSAKEKAGNLSATLHENGEVHVIFQPLTGSSGKWQAHVALLGLGVSNDVKAGENSGRHLVHDFVALSLDGGEMEGESPTAILNLPSDKIKSGHTAIAVWITSSGKLQPVQAAGGDL